MTLVANGLTDKPNELKKLQPVSFNIGYQNLVKHQQEVYTRQNFTGDQKYLIETILIDDLVDYIPLNYKLKRPKSVMKIDIEGFEAIAFQRAKRLFDSVDFCVIFMEWGQQAEQTAIHGLIDEMVQFLYSYDLRPFAFDKRNRVLEQVKGDWKKWPWDIVWKKTGF